MKHTQIYYKKKLKFKEPILIVGLPGIGSVGSLVGEHLKNELKAKRFATLYSPHFIHQTFMLKNGRTRLISNRFYYAVNKNQTILLLLGDTQAGTPEGQHEVSEKIVRFFKALGGKKIYTIGGYNSGSHYLSNPRVFAVATDQKTKSELSLNKIIFGTANGAIWGAAGLIISYAKKYKINAACIMGETSALDIDANAAKAVLNSLKDLLDIKINLDNINKIKEETDRLIKEMEQAAKDQEMQHSKDTFTYIR